jgi:CheY-like chemotaxis protein
MLIVDDEETIRWALRELFLQDGWEVHYAGDGDEARGLLDEGPYDFMITDLKMPGLPGVELIRTARQVNPAIGVMILTGYASLDTAIQAVRLRAWDYVTKPCEARYLKERIDEFMQQAGDRHVRPTAERRLQEDDLREFLAGAGTEIFSFGPLDGDEHTAGLLDRLGGMFAHLGCGERRAGELVQMCVEAIALMTDGEGGGFGRVGLLKGHVLVSVSGSSDPGPGRALDDLSGELGVDARLVAGKDRKSIVLSEGI